jgi:hypothetical protein
MSALRLSQRVGLTSLVLLFFSVSWAGAWEFSTTGVFTWEFYQFGQLGAGGFFGLYDQDRSSVAGTVNLAARNGWLGHEIARNNVGTDDLTSGSDAAANYLYTTFYPKVKVNEALSIQGSYRIGSWATPSLDTSLGQLNASRYLNSQSAGIERSFSPGYWNLWYATATLPWGAVMVGKQPNTLGLGLIIDAYENTTEAVVISVPFGPFIIGGQYYPWGPGLGVNYPVKTDRNGASHPHWAAFLMYDTGNFSSHTYIEYTNGHQGPESQLLQNTAVPSNPDQPGRINFLPTDITKFFGFTNFRYFNGRFFFNAEVGFNHYYFKQSRSESNNPLPRTRYWELWAGMIESGAVAGPAKISFLWAYYPGPDRRAGGLIDRQPYIPGPLTNSGVIVYKPYSLLLGYDYGSGNASIAAASSHGFITDASTYAVRLDYAIAANLNAYATFLYAYRISQGYGWGWIRPNPSSTTNSPAVEYGLKGPFNAPTDLAFVSDAPNILERDLGYEIGGGFDWKLIEGYTLAARVAYWKPGAWFKYACVDRTQPNWNIPDAGNRWGINPNREIDPIFGTRIALQVDF